MALNSLGLGFVFTAKDFASAKMNKVAASFKTLDKVSAASMAKMKAAMKQGAAGIALLAGGAVGLGASMKLASKFGEFDAALAKVQGRIGATADDMKLLEERAIRAGIETQFSPTEAVQGLEELTSKGLNATDATKALGGALDLAAAGQISVASASDTVVSAMNVFGISADKAGDTADKLLKVTSMTALSAGDMQQAMGNLSRGVSQTNQSFEEMLVLTGLVKNTGVDVSVAASSISSALLSVSKHADKFRKIGVEVTDAEGKFKDLGTIMLDAQKILEKKYPDAADRAKKGYELFTKFGLTAFGGVMKQVNTGLKDQNGQILKGAAAIKNYIDRVKTAEGFGAKARLAKESTLPGQITLLKGSLQTLGIEIGRSFSDVFKPIVEIIRNVVNQTITFVQMIPAPLKDVIAKFIVFGSAGAIVAGTILTIVAAFKLAAVAAAAFGVTLSSVLAPLLPIVAGVAAVAAAIYAIKVAFDNIEGFRERVIAFGDGFREGFAGAIEAAQPVFDAFKNALVEVKQAFGFLLQSIFDTTGGVKQAAGVGATIGIVFGKIGEVLTTVATVVMKFVTGFIQGMGIVMRAVMPAVDSIIDSFGIVFDVLGDVLSSFGLGSESAMSFGDVIKAVGTAIAFVVSKGLVLLITKLAVVARVFAAVFRFIGGVVKMFVNQFKAAIEVVLGLFALVTGDIDGFKDHFANAFKFVGEAIKAPFVALFKMVIDIMDGILDYVADLILQLPEAFVPDGMVRFAQAQQNRAPRLPVLAGEQDAIKTAAVERATTGIAADQERKQTSESKQQQTQQEFANLVNAAIAQGNQRPVQVNTNVELDGETIARAVGKANTGDAGGSFGADMTGDAS